MAEGVLRRDRRAVCVAMGQGMWVRAGLARACALGYDKLERAPGGGRVHVVTRRVGSQGARVVARSVASCGVDRTVRACGCVLEGGLDMGFACVQAVCPVEPRSHPGLHDPRPSNGMRLFAGRVLFVFN